MNRLEDLDLNLLILLHWLLEEESVTRAAERVGISQPAASRGLQRLRETFADELLVRTGRTHVLSRLATSIKPDLAAAIASLRQVTRTETAFVPHDSVQAIVIAANDYLSSLCSQAWVDAIAPKAPSMTTVWRPLAPSILGELATGEVDFVVMPDAARSNVPEGALLQDLVVRPLVRDRFVVFARPSHPVFEMEDITAEALAMHESVLVSPTGSGPAVLDPRLEAQGLKRRVAHRTAQFTHAADLALAADMLAILPERFARNKPGGRIAPVPLEGGAVESRLVWHASRTSDLAHKWVRNQLTDYFHDTGSDTP